MKFFALFWVFFFRCEHLEFRQHCSYTLKQDGVIDGASASSEGEVKPSINDTFAREDGVVRESSGLCTKSWINPRKQSKVLQACAKTEGGAKKKKWLCTPQCGYTQKIEPRN